MTLPDLPAVERIEAVRLQPGDKVIVHAPVKAPEQAKYVREVVADRLSWPEADILVLGDGIEIEVMNADHEGTGD